MARETTEQQVPGATATAEKARASRRTTTTTPTAPLGVPANAPIVEQVNEGADHTPDIPRPTAELLADRDYLTSQLRHLIGCPIEGLPWEAGDGQPSRSTRIDVGDITEPRSSENPFPRTYRVMQCNECGARARVKLPRTDDD